MCISVRRDAFCVFLQLTSVTGIVDIPFDEELAKFFRVVVIHPRLHISPTPKRILGREHLLLCRLENVGLLIYWKLGGPATRACFLFSGSWAQAGTIVLVRLLVITRECRKTPLHALRRDAMHVLIRSQDYSVLGLSTSSLTVGEEDGSPLRGAEGRVRRGDWRPL